MVKILILGASGMLGSMLYKTLAKNSRFEVWGTLRNGTGVAPNLFESQHLVYGDLLTATCLTEILNQVQPAVIINCIGVIKQKLHPRALAQAIKVNAVFPHYLATLCQRKKIRLIHISTDCVFSGDRGFYTEFDRPDAADLYGISKRYGEIFTRPNTLTLRTSIIGPERNSNYALLDWFLAQKDTVTGFSKAIFSGLTTLELSRLLERILLFFPDLWGIYHLSADPIDKYSLLKLIAIVYCKDTLITANSSVVIDRSLDSSRLRSILSYQPPSWHQMLKDLHSLDLQGLKEEYHV